MHISRLITVQIIAELADSLKKWQGLDITNGSADFAEHEIKVFYIIQDKFLNGICDMRDNLNGRAKLIAPALFLDNGLVDAPRRDIVRLPGRNTGKTFVMSQIKISLRTIIRYVTLAVFERVHGTRINIEVGVELPEPDFIAPCLQK